jgi:hypothetical protein
LVEAAVGQSFTVRNVGRQTLVLDDAISVPAGFGVVSSFGSTVLAQGESTSFSVQLQAATVGSFSGQISFGTNDGDENPFGFQVMGTVTAVQILDDGDAGFTTSGDWTSFGGAGYQGDLHYASAGDGSRVARWISSVPAGEYLVAATWTPSVNRATDAPYTIRDGSVTLGTVRVNQKSSPSDFGDQGTSWEVLGVFQVRQGALIMELSDDARDFVIADAIRIERIGEGMGTVVLTVGQGNARDHQNARAPLYPPGILKHAFGSDPTPPGPRQADQAVWRAYGERRSTDSEGAITDEVRDVSTVHDGLDEIWRDELDWLPEGP